MVSSTPNPAGEFMETPSSMPYTESAFCQKAVRPPEVDLSVEPDAPQRLNIVLPNYMKNYAFGGITSALELARELTGHYGHIRFVSLAPLGLLSEMFDFGDYVLDPGSRLVEMDSTSLGPLKCHQRDIFFCTIWTSALLWEEHARALKQARLQPNPFYYAIQDYEPGFYAWGYRERLCRATYGHPAHTHAIFNSHELHGYFQKKKLRFAGEHVVAPSLNPMLRGYLEHQDWTLTPKKRDQFVMLAYGRPGEHRNCFQTLTEGLDLFSKEADRRVLDKCTVISAGQAHPELIFEGGLRLQSVGKLPLNQYVAALENANIGISLMASPHPSYPPLEMATFGLKTITNAFANKNLTKTHPGFISLRQTTPRHLADALHKAVKLVQEAPEGPQKAQLPTVLSHLPWRNNIIMADIGRLDSPN